MDLLGGSNKSSILVCSPFFVVNFCWTKNWKWCIFHVPFRVYDNVNTPTPSGPHPVQFSSFNFSFSAIWTRLYVRSQQSRVVIVYSVWHNQCRWVGCDATLDSILSAVMTSTCRAWFYSASSRDTALARVVRAINISSRAGLAAAELTAV